MWLTKEEFSSLTELNKEQLLALTRGTLIKDQPEDCPTLPAPPLLMLDRVYGIEHNKKRGKIIGEKDVKQDDWFFQCHFRDDPIMPGCLGLDAIWQLIGLYNSLRDVSSGQGRALGCGEADFFGQIQPHHKVIRYEVDVKRVSYSKPLESMIIVADGDVFVDDTHIYSVKSARVGLFQNLRFREYPFASNKDHDRLKQLAENSQLKNPLLGSLK